jgi:hypothetical protein
LNLSIENPTARSPVAPIQVFDPFWLAAHPDLTVAELASFVRMVQQYQERIDRGDVVDPETYQSQPFAYPEAIGYIHDSAAYLRGVLSDISR